MKITKRIIVSTLSTAMGVSLVGAITGTVAWYQYSTRSTVSFLGASVGNSRSLEVSLTQNDADFKPDLNRNDLNFSNQLSPITTGAQLKDDALAGFLAQPVYQHFGYSEWLAADSSAYVQFTVYLRLKETLNDGSHEVVGEARKVYLKDAAIQNDDSNLVGDISDAIRVHVASDQGAVLFSKNGGNTNVFGKLDLNGDGELDDDKPAYDFITHNAPKNYGGDNLVQEAYGLDDVRNGLLLGTLHSKEVVFDENEQFEQSVVYYDDAALEHVTTDETPVANKKYYVSQPLMPVTVTIWLEGWHALPVVKSIKPESGFDLSTVEYYTDAALSHRATGSADGNTTYYYSNSNSAMWDLVTYVGAKFDVGLLFEVEEQLS